eukprot:Sro1539_g280821.1  (253) ;mRNA; f:8592-9567
MNDARQLYLNFYNGVDKLDHLIHNCNMGYREKLAKQMLAYAPRNCKYLGDEKMSDTTTTNKSKRPGSKTPPPRRRPADDELTTASGVTTDEMAGNNHGDRLCGFITPLLEQYQACQTMPANKKLNCVFCGKASYQKCAVCDKPMHKFASKEGDNSIPCFFHYHNTAAMGLARDDWRVTNKRLKDWTYPSASDFEDNETQMRRLLNEMRSSDNNSTGGRTSDSGNNSNTTDGQQSASTNTTNVNNGGDDTMTP